jgi:phosphoglycerate kinase
MRSIRDVSVQGKRVLVRCDFNVPLDAQGEIADDFRIQESLPTIEYLQDQGAKIILLSHLGDPDGVVQERFSLDRVAARVSEYVHVPVVKAHSCIGSQVQKQVQALKKGDILVLENVRFHKEEEQNDQEFAKELAGLGDIFCNDAFGVVHRNHASVVSVPLFLPSFAGLLLEKELDGLQKLVKNPERPMVAIVGGKKIESKLPTINNIAKLADSVLLGNMLAQEIISKNIHLEHADKVILPVDGVPGNGKEYDIGPITREQYVQKVREARTIFWAGPLGKYEDKEYAIGSLVVARAIVEDTSYAVAGGGNLLDFLGKAGLRGKFDHISTGGSSMLAFLAGQKLPGLQALQYYASN